MGKAIRLEFIRSIEESNFLNRVCREVGAKDSLYYIEVGSDKKATFHRGGAKGPVIAEINICEDKQGSSEAEMPELSTTISFQHMPRKMVIVPPKTFFSYNGNKYYWKGYTDLFAEKNDKLLAQYQATAGNESDKFGELIVTEADKNLIDLIVISSFILQRRSDARKRAGSVGY